MFYQREVLIPANTPARTPVVDRLNVFPGLATHAWFMFPAGCYGLAHIQVWHQGWQIWPWTPLESFHWDNHVFDFEDRYPIESEPYEFVVKAWNEDDFFSHSIIFAVTVDPAPQAESYSSMVTALSMLGFEVR